MGIRPLSFRTSRRALLGMGVATAGLALAQRSGLVSWAQSGMTPPFIEPPVISSHNGLLEVTLDARFGQTWAMDRPAWMLTYNGVYPGPTLHVRPGDIMRIRLINNLDQMTNFHTHGLHVSPAENSDNVLAMIHAGQTYEIVIQLPPDHPAGLNWYHPHMHGLTEPQINAGLAGALIVEGHNLDELPGVAGIPRHIFVLTVTQLDANGVWVPMARQDHAQWIRLVNGRQSQTLTMRPGETRRWAVVNASADTFVDIQLDGHQLYLISEDANTLPFVEAHDHLVMAPGQRFEFIVQAGPEGVYQFRTLAYDQGFFKEPEVELVTLVSTGVPLEPLPLPTSLWLREDLRLERVDRRRVVTFSETDDPFRVLIDGREFSMDRDDQIVQLGAVEEWEIVNTSTEQHPFHIHTNEFQVIAINGQPIDRVMYRDVISLPENGGWVTVRHRFADFTGRPVYHCHIVGHEDAGMMSAFRIQQ